ncbi:MAG: hypothetical protein WC044_12095 [Crocinitomicaceae bacterium]
MKKIIYSFVFMFSLSAAAQDQEYNYNFDMSMFTLRDIEVPKDLEGIVKSVKVNTKKKKSAYSSESKFDEKGRVIERTYQGKHPSQTKAAYNENGSTKFYSYTRDNKLQHEKINTFDKENRLIESIMKDKKGQISQKNTWTFAEGNCPVSSQRFVKNGEKLKRSWEYSYYSACDKSKTVLKNAKGKVIKTWSYDCKKEGEQLIKKKDETQVCRWDESDGKFLTKVEQGFDEKGRIRKTVSKYNLLDTTIVEYARYDKNDRLLSKSTYLGSYKKQTSYESFNKKGKRKFGQFFEYKGETKVKEVYYTNQRISRTTNYEINEKGLITRKESLDKKGKITSTSIYEYVMQ